MIAVTDKRARRIDGVKSSPLQGLTQGRRIIRPGSSLQFDALRMNEAYASLYASQPWVYALVNKLARGMARLPLKQYGRQADDQRERLKPADPLRRLIERPYERGTRFRMIEATVGNLALYGNALLWKFREGAGQPPAELWPLDWRYISFEVGGASGVNYYQYEGPQGRRRFLPEDVIHFQWWSPNGEAGTSPLEALRVTLALENAGRGYAVSSFANGVRPSGALVTPKTLDPGQKEELRQEIQALNAGPDKAFRIALLDGGMEWRPFAHTAQEAETIEHRKLNREEVCAVYDIPPPAVQILDRATFSNITEQNKALYREAFGPWTAMIEETFEAQLIAPEPAFLGDFVEFDMAEVLKSDLPVRAAAYRSMETTVSLNERRRIENLPPIGDVNDKANPANGVAFPLNTALILGDGTVLNPGGAAAAPADQAASALSRLVREQLDALIAERGVDLTADPVTLPAE